MKLYNKTVISSLVIFLLVLASIPFWSFNASAGKDSKSYLPVVLNFVGGDVEPTATPTNSPVPTGGPSGSPTPASCSTKDNLLSNGDFEAGQKDWSFYSNGQGEFEVDNDAFQCDFSAKVLLQVVGNSAQLYQRGFLLRNGSRYKLTFSAFSSSGTNMAVYVHQQNAPYQNYGLSKEFDLQTNWQTFAVEFDAKGINGTTNDSRLRFWFADRANNGDIYRIENIRLQEMGAAPTSTPSNTNTPGPSPTKTPPGSTATPNPTSTSVPGSTATPNPTSTSVPGSTATPRPTATPGGGGGQELLVFNLNRSVTKADRGFPNDTPPINNFDWTKPINYAAGTLHYRVEIYNQPQPQNMRLQFCFWQEKNGYLFELENCGPLANVYGSSGTVVTWSTRVDDMWKKDGNSIEWYRPRYRNGVAIKNSNGDPVSDYNGWNWYGENPDAWYPLNMNFRVVVVAPGAQFSGWENYADD